AGKKQRELATVVQGRGIADETPERPAPDSSLHCRSTRDQESDRKYQPIDTMIRRVTDPEVQQQRAEECPRKGIVAADEHGGHSDARRRKNRCRVSRGNGEKKPQPPDDDIGRSQSTAKQQ